MRLFRLIFLSMSIFERNTNSARNASSRERRRLPIMIKMFLGFLALLAFVLIGNVVFLYQLSRLNRIIKSTSNGMYRIVIAQDMRKKLSKQRRDRGLYHAMKIDISIEDAEEAIEGFESNLDAETKRLKAKHGRDIVSIDKLNDLSATFMVKGNLAMEYLRNDSLNLAYNVIRSDSFTALANEIRDEIDKANKRYGLKILTSDFGSLRATIQSAVLLPFYMDQFRAGNDSLRTAADSLALLKETKDTTSIVIADNIDSLASIFSREAELKKTDNKAWDETFARISTPLEDILNSEVTGVSQTFRESQRAVAFTRSIGIWGALGLFGLGILIAMFIARKIAAPIAELRMATHSASRGEWEKRIIPTTNDEIGDLTEDFNKMLHDLGELDVMKSRFLASITHDLKSPIGRVRGNIANLQDELLGPVNDGQAEMLDMMSKDVDKLSRLIHDILDLQKIKAGAFKLDLAEVQLKTFVLSILEPHAQVLIEKGIYLGVKLDIEDVATYIDKKQFERIFDNLVGNAIKYTSSGGKIFIEARPEGSDILFRVIDTGVGIPEDHLAHVFDEFYQAGQKVKGVKGTGLGLTIVKQLVEAHGGKIWVESKPKMGTVFAFTIPLERPML